MTVTLMALPSDVNACSDTVPLTCGATAEQFVLGAGSGQYNPSDGPYDTPGQEAAFSFTPTQSGSHTISTTNDNCKHGRAKPTPTHPHARTCADLDASRTPGTSLRHSNASRCYSLGLHQPLSMPARLHPPGPLARNFGGELSSLAVTCRHAHPQTTSTCFIRPGPAQIR